MSGPMRRLTAFWIAYFLGYGCGVATILIVLT